MYSLNFKFRLVPVSESRVYILNEDGKNALITSSQIDLIEYLRLIYQEADISRYYPESLRPHVEKITADLEQLGVITNNEIPSGNLERRYITQRNYFSRFEESTGASKYQLQNELSNSTVMIIGCGSLGTWVSQSLGTIGIGTLILVDHDIVDISNLSRSCMFSPSDVGKYKVDVVERELKKNRPDLKLLTYKKLISSKGDIASILGENRPNIVIQTGDEPPIDLGILVTQECHGLSLPLLRMTALGVGPLYDPKVGGSSCNMCDFFRMRDSIPDWQNIVGYRGKLGIDGSGFMPEIAIDSLIASSEVTRMLLKISSYGLLNRRLKFRAGENAIKEKVLTKYSNCEACNGQHAS